jgi:HD-like signal output (HDOD) protein
MNLHSGVAPPELPVLPSLKVRAMGVLWNPNADLRDMLSIVEGDPGLTASVLRAASTSFSAPSGPIRTASEAIEHLGVSGVQQIVTAAFARAEFDNLGRSDVHLEDFWLYQLAVGLLAECFCLVDQRPPDETDSAFTAGLIHQVGRLALMARNAERYRDVVQQVIGGLTPLEAEWQVLGDDSAHLTEQVAAHWGFPEPIPSALSSTIDSEAAGLPPLLHEARAVAALLGFSEGFSLELPTVNDLPADHPRATALAAIGGREALAGQIEWFRHASGGRTPLSLGVAA